MSHKTLATLFVKTPKQQCSGPFLVELGWLPPMVLGSNILSKEVETGPTATQFGPACAQAMPCLLGAHLRWTELF